MFCEVCLITRVSFRTRVTLHVKHDILLTTSNKSFSLPNNKHCDILCFAYEICTYPCNCVTLSVPCHRKRARAFTFSPVFPWRVTFVIEGNKFAKAGGRHLVNVSQKPNMVGLEVCVVFDVNFQHDIYPQVAQAL